MNKYIRHLFSFAQKVFRFLFHLFKNIYYRCTFQQFGNKSRIYSLLHLDGACNIIIGKKVTVQYKTWLAALPLTGGDKCILHIKDGATIGHFNHIYATKSIIIENDVLTADNVYISDNLHGYTDINVPIKNQPILQNKEVVIGEGTWLGENVCVLGAKIGKQCVVGANSVVNKDIPDYSVAVGIPARVVKRYCFKTKAWRKTDIEGNFI